MASSRLFFALWPDEITRASVARLAQRFCADYGGRQTATASLHITLVFLGNTLDERIPLLHAIARRIEAPPFTLNLTRAGSWRGGILWLAPDDPPEELQMLVGKLRTGIKSEGVPFDDKRFVPHMTLLRRTRARAAEIAIAPIEFALHDFALLRTVPQDGGVRHEVIGRFPLSGR